MRPGPHLLGRVPGGCRCQRRGVFCTKAPAPPRGRLCWRCAPRPLSERAPATEGPDEAPVGRVVGRNLPLAPSSQAPFLCLRCPRRRRTAQAFEGETCAVRGTFDAALQAAPLAHKRAALWAGASFSRARPRGWPANRAPPAPSKPCDCPTRASARTALSWRASGPTRQRHEGSVCVRARAHARAHALACARAHMPACGRAWAPRRDRERTGRAPVARR